MEALIHAYLQAHGNAWAPTTLRSEKFRLLANVALISANDPEAAFKHLSTVRMAKPYAIKTFFIRVSDFYRWAIELGKLHGPNQWRLFMETNARLFKNVYVKEDVNETYDSALAKIRTIGDPTIQRLALQMLASGARSSEILALDSSNMVIGKGGKARRLFLPAALSGGHGSEGVQKVTYRKLYSELKKVGLKPHTLRKLFTTKLVRSGLDLFEVMQATGHSSVQSLQSYVQEARRDELETKIKNAQEVLIGNVGISKTV